MWSHGTRHSKVAWAPDGGASTTTEPVLWPARHMEGKEGGENVSQQQLYNQVFLAAVKYSFHTLARLPDSSPVFVMTEPWKRG